MRTMNPMQSGDLKDARNRYWTHVEGTIDVSDVGPCSTTWLPASRSVSRSEFRKCCWYMGYADVIHVDHSMTPWVPVAAVRRGLPETLEVAESRRLDLALESG
jgi:hypothetical protein